MKKRVFSVFGVAAILIAGTQLFASDLPPFETSSDESGSATSITSAETIGVGDTLFEEDDACDAASVPAGYSTDGGSLPVAADGAVDGAAAPGQAAISISSNALPPPTPEPASIAMLLIGAAAVGLGVCRRKTRR